MVIRTEYSCSLHMPMNTTLIFKNEVRKIVDENNTAEGELEKIGGHLADVLTTTVHKRCNITAWRKSYETLVSAIALVYVPCRP